jgi:hypothetical protein
VDEKYLKFRHKLICFFNTGKGAVLFVVICFIVILTFGLDSVQIGMIAVIIAILVWLKRSHYSKERLKKLKLTNDLHLIVSIFNKCDCSLFIEYSNPENNKNNSSIYKEITSDNEIHILTTEKFWNMELPSNCHFDFLSLSITLNPEEDYINQKKYEIPLNRIRRLSFNDLRDEEMNENIYNCIFLPNLSKFLEPVLKKNIGS